MTEAFRKLRNAWAHCTCANTIIPTRATLAAVIIPRVIIFSVVMVIIQKQNGCCAAEKKVGQIWPRSAERTDLSGLGARRRVHQAFSSQKCQPKNSESQIQVSDYSLK